MTLIVLGLAWVAGLLAVGAWDAPWWMGGAWVTGTLPAFLAAGPLRARYALGATCVAAALASGWLLHGAREIEPPPWAPATGTEVRLTGTVASEPDRGQTVTGYVIEVDSIDLPTGGPASGGKVLVHLQQYARYLPGDRLTVVGTLQQPPTFDTFDYATYLARQDIWATMFRPRVVAEEDGGWSASRTLTSARLKLDRSLQRSLPEPEASLAAGIAFGREDGLSREALEDYNRSGLRHLVAVSGSNVVLVSALVYTVAIPVIGRRWAWLPAAFMVVTYLAAAGLSPSVLRSGLMAGVLLGGSAVGRPQSGLPALAAAIIAMTALSPLIALEPGFQLSATATAGLIVFSPWVSAGLLGATARARWFAVPKWVCDAAALTISATIATLPVMWATFGQVSVVSPIANILVQPAFALAFWLSIVTAGLGLAWRDAAEVAALFAYYPLAFIGATSTWFGAPRFSAIPLGGGGPTPAIIAYCLLGVTAAAAYRFRPNRTDEPDVVRIRGVTSKVLIAGASGAAALAIVPISLAPRGGPGDLVVDFLDVGQGDAALITTPGGRQILIDGGPSGIELARELGETMPHWDHSLDVVIVSHPQEDHIAGIPEIQDRFRIGTVLDSGAANETNAFARYHARAPDRASLTAGSAFEVDGVRFEVLWPPSGYEHSDPNNASVVLRVTHGDTTFLFTGDSASPAHEALARTADLRADVLKVPHHGSRTTSAAFLDAVQPVLAIISVGGENTFGHPHPATLSALGAVPTYRTDVWGRVRVRSDGSRITLETER